jgi:hypothetical protein
MCVSLEAQIGETNVPRERVEVAKAGEGDAGCRVEYMEGWHGILPG